MCKTIRCWYGEKEYTLEYDKKSIVAMERRGFNLAQIERMPLTMLTKLMSGAFLMHHPEVSQERAEEIFDHMKKRGELLEALSEMYAATVAEMYGDNEENGESWARG